MPKVVVNRCYGGFGLSHDAIIRYGQLANLNLLHVQDQGSFWVNYYYIDGIKDDKHIFLTSELERDDPLLVQVVHELGGVANGEYAELEIVDIPDNIEWFITEYDGIETVREAHRTW